MEIIREFESMLRETSVLTTTCQNEGNLNCSSGPATRKALHGGLTRKTMTLMDVEDWTTHKIMAHPTRS